MGTLYFLAIFAVSIELTQKSDYNPVTQFYIEVPIYVRINRAYSKI